MRQGCLRAMPPLPLCRRVVPRAIDHGANSQAAALSGGACPLVGGTCSWSPE